VVDKFGSELQFELKPGITELKVWFYSTQVHENQTCSSVLGSSEVVEL
jgi:hypothetical protein